MKFRSNFFLFVLLVFLSACGKETAEEDLQETNIQNESGQAGNITEESVGAGEADCQEQQFFASYDVYKQSDYSEEDRPLKNMQYLLTREALYAVGTYATAVEEETGEGLLTHFEDTIFLHQISLATRESKLLAEYPGETLLAMCEGEEDALVFTTARWRLPEDGGPKMQTEYILRIMDTESGECQEYSLNSMLDSIGDFGSFSAIDIRGDELAIADIMAKKLCVLNYREETVKQAVEMEGRTEYLKFADDGTLYVVQNEKNGTLYTLTLSGTTLTKQAEGFAADLGMTVAYAVDGDRLYIGTEEAMLVYDMNTKENTKLFKATTYDILVEGGLQILHHSGEQGEIWQILTTDADTNSAEICTLSETALDGGVPEEKEVIVLSNFWAYPEMQKMVTAFNKSNDKYRVEIEVAPFSQDYETYVQNRNMEILSGEGPDLFSVNETEYKTYAEGGYLVDLKPYMDAELNGEDYLKNILYGEEKDGKVYAAVTSFQIHMAVSRKDIVGDLEGWTFEEMCEVMEAHPEIEAFIPYADENAVLQYCYLYGGVEADDYDTLRECILFAEKYGVNLPQMEAVLGKNVLLQEEAILTPRNLQYLLEVSDKYAMVGYPNADRQGVFRGGSTWSINANSKNVEGAWEFIKFLLEEYQYDVQDMPVLTAAYETKITAAMTPNTYMDYNIVTGEEVEVEEPYSTWNGVPLYAMTKEQVQAFRDLVERSNNTFSDFDWAAWNIVSEEAGAYFNGDKPLDDVMDAIEGRMRMYISENER